MKKRAVPVLILLMLILLLPACGAQGEKSLLFTFTGDCTIGSEPSKYKQANSFHSFVSHYGYDYFFSNFREMFRKDDLTVINLEGVFTDDPLEAVPKTYCFRGPSSFANILTGSSVEAANLANNHTLDFGNAGYESTKKILEDNQILWFANENYIIWEHDGLKIALFGSQSTKLKGRNQFYVKTIRALKETGAVNAVIFSCHIGTEYAGYRNDYAEAVAHDLTDAGADLIIMHHPHVLQGMDILHNRTVFYSLGNFVFGGNSAIRTEKDAHKHTVTSRYSMAVQARLTFTNEGQYLGQQITIYPCYTSVDPQINFFRPIRVNKEKAVPIRQAIQDDTPFELPAITEDGPYSRMVFDYLPASDEPMVAEDD